MMWRRQLCQARASHARTGNSDAVCTRAGRRTQLNPVIRRVCHGIVPTGVNGHAAGRSELRGCGTRSAGACNSAARRLGAGGWTELDAVVESVRHDVVSSRVHNDIHRMIELGGTRSRRASAHNRRTTRPWTGKRAQLDAVVQVIRNQEIATPIESESTGTVKLRAALTWGSCGASNRGARRAHAVR